MNELDEIIEEAHLLKFKKLAALIISQREPMGMNTPNNRNGYFGEYDEKGNPLLLRTLLGQSPHRADETAAAMREAAEKLVETAFYKPPGPLNFQPRKTGDGADEKEKVKNSMHLITVFAIRYHKRIFVCGGLQAHECVAMIILFLRQALHDFYSPDKVPQKYDLYDKDVYQWMINQTYAHEEEKEKEKAEQLRKQKEYLEDAMILIDKIDDLTKQNRWARETDYRAVSEKRMEKKGKPTAETASG